jgi:four helix bundle protein
VINKANYNLEERTYKFGSEIIKLAKLLPVNLVNRKLVDQFVRSGTSVGANYREANETETKKDFQFRIRICRKEAKETVYWLKLLKDANLNFDLKIDPLVQEAGEFVKIFAAIVNKTRD